MEDPERSQQNSVEEENFDLEISDDSGDPRSATIQKEYQEKIKSKLSKLDDQSKKSTKYSVIVDDRCPYANSKYVQCKHGCPITCTNFRTHYRWKCITPS